jgi:hypothetical protein
MKMKSRTGHSRLATTPSTEVLKWRETASTQSHNALAVILAQKIYIEEAYGSGGTLAALRQWCRWLQLFHIM